MQLLVNYSGLFAAFFSLTLVALPSLYLQYDKKKLPISYTGTVGRIKFIFNLGVIASAISEIIFIALLISKFPEIFIGALIFLCGSICLIIAGIVNLKKSYRLHTISATLYFSLTSIGALLISSSILQLNFNIGIVATIFSLSEIIFMIYFYVLRKNNSLCEYSAILFSSFWALSFYVIK